ncbi:MAG: tRNA (N(6)-L-threonylcarbamoyladenosine(37)-C(2))-methylthiotransferase MtaB [Nitrospirota bacterium]
MKIAICTLGCKVNQSESSVIEGNLSERGHAIVNLSDGPDYCVINTCSVTSKSEYQSRQLIRRAAKSGARVIVTGCYAQLRTAEIERLPGVERVIDNNKKLGIIKLLSGKNETISFSFSSRARPYVKIQDGCNNSCAYCVVPLARGKSKSIEMSEIIQQVKSFESLQYNEVALTGIHIGSYGHDLRVKCTLADLLKNLLRNTQIPRIRLSSLEVSEIDEVIIEMLQDRRLCKHLHIPLQSGDDGILKLMRRRYTTRQYVDILEKIIKRIPQIAVGTDVIVGFPGEGEGEFLNTKGFLEGLPICYMHIFPFSARPGTVAAGMRGQNAVSVKKERATELRMLNAKKKREYLVSQVNRILDIIIEEQIKDRTLVGTSGNYLKVRVDSVGYSKKSLVHVRINGTDGDMLTGDVVDSS